MRVAVVGAGLAGLACAHELERLGHSCEVFEKRDRVGKMFTTVELMLQAMVLKPGQDIFDMFRKELHLPINPAAHIRRAVLHSRRQEATIAGHLGYTTIRGAGERSLEAQLARHIRSPIHFDHEADVRKLQAQYDWVVVATGSPQWPKAFGLWTTDVDWWVRGASVVGDFNPSELHFYFNTRYAKVGYGMIAPYDERTASVGIGVPGSSEQEMIQLWEAFRRDQEHFWEDEVDSFHLNCYEVGRVKQRQYENLLFVGNAGGFIEPIGTSGQTPSLRSGIYAARKLAQRSDDFDQFCVRWDKFYEHLLHLRLNANAWTDHDMDRLVALAGHGIGSLLAVSPWNLLNTAGAVLPLLPVAQDPSPEVGPQ